MLGFPLSILAVHRTAGDGGGGLYKRAASEPSHEGKIQSNDGAWWELSETRVTPQMFGAYGDWTEANSRDDTQAFQDAIDYVTSFTLPGEAFPMQRQGKVIYVPEGKYGIKDTLDRGASFGFLSFIGDAQHASIIVWDKRTAGHIPFIDLGGFGENFQFRNIHTFVPDVATLPSTWITTTTFIDHGFRVDGSYFYNAEDSIIQLGGCINANLVNWRCEGTNNCIIKMTDIGNQPRTFNIADFTLHARDATNSAEYLTVLASFFDITLGTSNIKHFMFKDCSIELDTGAITDPFQFFVLRGESNRTPSVMVTFDGVGIFRQTAEADPDITPVSRRGQWRGLPYGAYLP
jgi:hypothetical protein